MLDGCYYEGRTPLFRISGSDGRVLVPGEVRRFAVRPSTDWRGNDRVTFTPGFLPVQGGGAADDGVVGFYDRRGQTLPLRWDGQVPVITLYMAAYGEVEVRRGPRC